jgi:hypothetical protein
MERLELLRTLGAIRRLSRVNPLSTGEARLSKIKELVDGKADPLTVLRNPRQVTLDSIAKTEARKARTGRDRMERSGQDRSE